MTPGEAARASAAAVSGVGSHFMMDGPTYARGAALGFQGLDFYLVGRGGVLGDVDADVVAAAIVFFNPATVRAMWESSATVMPRAQGAREFMACGHQWAEAHFPGDLDAEGLADLAGRLIAVASPAAAPLFAAWRAEPEPTGPKALALHRMNLLRELRGGLHGACVVASGLTPVEAVYHNSPYMAPVYGWDAVEIDEAVVKPAWDAAQAATDRAMAPVFEVLTEAERARFVDLADAARAAAGA